MIPQSQCVCVGVCWWDRQQGGRRERKTKVLKTVLKIVVCLHFQKYLMLQILEIFWDICGSQNQVSSWFSPLVPLFVASSIQLFPAPTNLLMFLFFCAPHRFMPCKWWWWCGGDLFISVGFQEAAKLDACNLTFLPRNLYVLLSFPFLSYISLFKCL